MKPDQITSRFSIKDFWQNNWLVILIWFVLFLFIIIYSLLTFSPTLKPVTQVDILKSHSKQIKVEMSLQPFYIAANSGNAINELVGWVFPEDDSVDFDPQKNRLLLQDQSGNIYMLPMEVVIVTGFESDFPNYRRDLSQSGFSIRIPKYALPKDTYQIGFLFTDGGENEYISFSQKYISRTANSFRLISRKEMNRIASLSFKSRIRNALTSVFSFN